MTEITNDNIVSAVNEWHENRESAITKYGDIKNWDVSQVINMANLFNQKQQFNEDISGWNVSNVKNMNRMFYSASSFNQDINGWVVGSVTDMSWMFRSASLFNQDLGSWDVSNVIYMDSMLSRASFFDKDISSWDVSNVINMKGMFQVAFNFNQNIRSWDVSNVTNMTDMFNDATEFLNYNGVSETPDPAFFTPFTDSDLKTAVDEYWPNDATEPVQSARQKYGYIRDWDVSLVTDMEHLFRMKSNFNEDISNWDVSNVIVTKNMFESCEN